MIRLADITSTYRAKIIAKTYKNWLRPEMRALDVGCGNGVVTKFLSENLGVIIEGCDIENYLSKQIKFKIMEKNDELPYDDNSFDAVMFNDVLHHTSKTNQKKLINEALRVGGKILIFEVIPTPIAKIADYIINKIHNPRMTIPLTFRKVSDWEKLFRKLGLNYKTVIAKKPFLYPFPHIAFMLKR